MKTVHIDQSIKKFICDKCPFKAHAVQYLTDHKRQNHGEETEKIGFSCERCKNNFKNEGFFHHHVCKSESGKALLSFRFERLIWSWISRASGWQTERADCNYIFEKIIFLENYFHKDKSVGL